jgi:hypothetical protein
LLSKLGDLFTGWRPVRIACIAVEYQCTGLKCRFEFITRESHRLVMVVRTYNLERQTVVHLSLPSLVSFATRLL